ncbi:MAG: cobalamin B12-binding domain-containing protein [Comamonadaceae bacterium]|nr:MAG: cobalamin B12-binding domain-containing protein [Comamonadaceae bacterium]
MQKPPDAPSAAKAGKPRRPLPAEASNVWPLFGGRDASGRHVPLPLEMRGSGIDSPEFVRHDATPKRPPSGHARTRSGTQEISKNKRVGTPGPTRRQDMPPLARQAKDPQNFGESHSNAAPAERSPPQGRDLGTGDRRATQDRHTRLTRTLEIDIIPRLVDVHRAMPSMPGGSGDAQQQRPTPTMQDVEDFVQIILAREAVAAQAFIDVMGQRGMSVETLYLDLLAPAAQHLSYLWSQDLCDFTQVTLGLARMQRLLHELSPGLATERELRANARRILLLPVQGEQQTFGLSMVAEFFHHAGWEVDCGNGGSPAAAARAIAGEWFDVVGLSAGSETRLEDLRDAIQELRELSRNRQVGVLVGGPIFAGHPERVKFVGADGAGLDGKQAPVHAERLIPHRPPGR